MNENKIAFFIIVGVLGFVGILWYAFENPAINPRLNDESYTIMHKWDLPNELNEISGIYWISTNKVACVQDEDGIIFIYNLATELIEKKINFANAGDYEAITVIDSTAYVMESNGKLFEVINYLNQNIETKEYQTPFSGKNNMESLVADSINKRLLFTVKNRDPNSEAFKGIYVFDIETKETQSLPIAKIDLNNEIFLTGDSDDDADKLTNFFPSEIAINPKNRDYYVLDAKTPQLLILDSNGKPKMLHRLYKDSFAQPEGITFSPSGTLYISNEGKNGTANILEVKFE